MADHTYDANASQYKEFAMEFWRDFYEPRTLNNVVRHFVANYRYSDAKVKNAFAVAIVEDCIIMRRVDRRKLADLIDSALSETGAPEYSRRKDRTVQVPGESTLDSDNRDLSGAKLPPTGRLPDGEQKLSIFQIDRLDGYAFQEMVADILRHNGYADVEVMGKSHDQGGDVLAKIDGKRIIIQVKRYTIDRKVSNDAVMAAYAAKAYYDTDEGAVISNVFYTKSAKDLAGKTGITLWDRRDLTNFIARYNDSRLEPDTINKA